MLYKLTLTQTLTLSSEYVLTKVPKVYNHVEESNVHCTHKETVQ